MLVLGSLTEEQEFSDRFLFDMQTIPLYERQHSTTKTNGNVFAIVSTVFFCGYVMNW
jgi:hypothetical protein